MKLLLLENYDPLIILQENYILKQEDYLPSIDLPGKTVGEIYESCQDKQGQRSASIGDIIQLKSGLFIIMPIGYRKVKWGDIIDFTSISAD